MKKVLTVAGSDCSGGAGIQADIKTITMHKMYAMSVITAVTAQNTMGVTDVENINPLLVGKQLDAVFCDIFPDGIKTGMVSSVEIIEKIADKFKEYDAKNIVVDPVMVSTSGHRLISEDAVETVINKLMPLARVVTPNLSEAEVISGIKITDREGMLKGAKIIAEKIETSVLLKGGHLDGTDLLYENGDITWILGEKINNPNTHGTGCTLSSAIACNLAEGQNLKDAVKNAKAYLTGAISAKLDIGKGRGPLMHNYILK